MRIFIGLGLTMAMVGAWADSIYQLPAIATTAAPPISEGVSASLGDQVVISASDISRAGVDSLTELLNHVSGVRYDAGVGANPQIFIRGKPALILVNGVPLTNFSMAAPDIDLIDLNQVKEVIITPGSAGVEYGDDAIGGVINIITSMPQKPQTTVTVTAGFPWSEDFGIQTGMPLSNQWSMAGGGEVQNATGYRAYSNTTQSNLNGSVQKKYANGSLTWQWQGMHQNMQYPGALTAAQVSQDRTQSGSDLGTFANNALDNVVRWQQQLGDQWQSQTIVHQNQQWGVATFVPLPTASQLSSIWALDQRFIKNNQWFNLPVHWQMGVDVEQDQYSYSGEIAQSQRIESALYTTSRWQLPDHIDAVVGVRGVLVNTNGQFYEYDGNTGQMILQPQARQTQTLWLTTQELSKPFTEDLKGYVRRAQSYQLPFIDQSSYTQGSITLQPGFGLQPQTATSYEAGLNWHPGHWQLGSEWYVMNVRNEIAYATDPANPSTEVNVNLPPTRHIGVLLNAENQLTQQWQMGGQFNASRQWLLSGDNAGNQLPDAPDWLLDVNSRYHFSDRWALEGDAQYTGSEFADGDFGNSYGKVPGYWELNTALTYQYHHWVSSFRIDNLTNTYYNLYTTVIPNADGSGNQLGYYPAPGRVFLWNVQYVFG